MNYYGRTDGAVLFILGLGLFLWGIFSIEFCFAMLGYILQLILLAGSIYLVANAIAYIINLLKNKHFIEPIIIIAILVICCIVKAPFIDKFKPFGFEYTFIAKKILGLGIIGLAIYIREKYNDGIKPVEKIEETFFIIATLVILCCSGFLIYKNDFNETIFISQNSKMETFWENRRIKKEAKKLNLRSELELILKEYQKDNTLEFSREGINKIIAKYGYRGYNGIACYAIEDNGTNWIVGMHYGEVLTNIINDKNLGNTGNYYVDKNTFEITGVYSETEPQN